METLLQNPFLSIDNRLKAIETKLASIDNCLSQKDTPEKKFYSIAEASNKLGVAQITLYRGIQSGKIPSKNVGTRLVIPGSFVDK